MLSSWDVEYLVLHKMKIVIPRIGLILEWQQFKDEDIHKLLLKIMDGHDKWKFNY